MYDSAEENWDNEGTHEATNYRKSNYEPRNGTYEKRSEHDNRNRVKNEAVMDVPSASIGLIVGRGGANIKRVQEDYHVHISLDRQENTATVTGENQHDVQDALNYLKDQIEKSQRDRGQNDRYASSSNDYRQHSDRNRKSGYDGGGGRDGRRDENRSSYRFDGGDKRDGGSGRDRRREDNRSAYRFDEGDKRDGYGGDNRYEPREKNDFYNPPAEDNYSSDAPLIDWTAVNAKADIARRERWAKCPPLTKNFYKEHPEVTNLSAEGVSRMREQNNNTTASRVFEDANDGAKNTVPNPIWKFEQCFAEYPDLLAEIKKQGFTTPSPIQAQGWPVLLSGEDLIGIAQTGTGKTLAFLLPAMIHTEFQSIPRSERNGPNVLVMAPTRELALQIEKEVNKYSFRGMKAVCVYGGGNRREQICDVQKGVEIIICTPGRLNDLIQAEVINVNSITYLVLDEADRMLDMGFEPQIRKILLDIRPDRQTVMTSATWPPGVRRLAQSYMDNPIQVCVGTLDLAATHTVTQICEIMEEDEKYHRIRNFVRNMQPEDKIIIFCGKKTRADDLSSDLTLEGEMCQSIHGARDQADREQAIADITTGHVKILIATDVASRGLDIEDITHVINFDFPRNIEEYVHRVGRTGRAGRTGFSISYLTRSDWGQAQPLIDILNEAGQEVPDELVQMASRFSAMKDRRANELSKIGDSRGRYGGGGRGGGGRGGGGYSGRNRY